MPGTQTTLVVRALALLMLVYVASAANSVKIYDHNYLGGAVITLNSGNYPNLGAYGFDNRMSSFVCQKDFWSWSQTVWVMFYDYNSYTGNFHIVKCPVTENVVPLWFNDQASSVRLFTQTSSNTITCYQGFNQGGLLIGTASLGEVPNLMHLQGSPTYYNTIASYTLSPYTIVTMYTGENYQLNSITIQSGASSVSGNLPADMAFAVKSWKVGNNGPF